MLKQTSSKKEIVMLYNELMEAAAGIVRQYLSDEDEKQYGPKDMRVVLNNRIHRNGEILTDKEEKYEKLIEDIAKKYNLIYHFDYGLVCKKEEDVIKLKIARKLLLNLGLQPSEILKVGTPKHMWIMEVYYDK